MIAYNHNIKFIPQLKSNKHTTGSSPNTIIIEENSSINLKGDLKHRLRFFNNQEREVSLFTDREFAPTKNKQVWAFEVKDVLTFFWYSGSLKLEYIRHQNFTENLLEYWSLHIVLPIFFTVEETFDFLHAGAVDIDGNSILFTAESCGGKSTITDYFLKQGHSIISDDKVATFENDKHFFAVPAHPHHRPYRKAEDLGFFIKNFSSISKPIQAIYELQKVEKDDEIVITSVYGVEKFKSLRYASEINLFFMKSKRFVYLMQLAKIVPVYKVSIPWDLRRLQEVYHKIIEHSKSLK